MTRPTPTSFISTHRDHLRQALNVVLSVSQVVAIVWAFAIKPSFSFDVLPQDNPPVIPAGYAFTIWFVIYAGCVAYAVYQALPAQREKTLLRRIGWWSTAAFLSSTLWAVTTGLGWYLITNVLIFALFASLLGALIVLIKHQAQLTVAERLLVKMPLSIYLGYVTVATVANTAATLKQQYGVVTPLGLSETTWVVVMLVIAGLLAAFTTVRSRGNAGYALAVVWALIGIAVANVTNQPNTVVAFTASGMAAFVALALLAARAPVVRVSIPQ